MPVDNAHSHSDLRSDPRHTPRIRLETTGLVTAKSPPGSPTYGVRVLDLSLGGARLISRQPCAPGQDFRVILQFRPHLLRLDTTVVWVKTRAESMFECGVAITGCSSVDRHRLTSILSNRLRPQGAANCAFYPAKPAKSSNF